MNLLQAVTKWESKMLEAVAHRAKHFNDSMWTKIVQNAGAIGSGEAIDPSPRSTTSSCASIECFLSAPCRTEPAARGGWGDGVRAVSNAGGEEVASSRPHAA